MFKDMDFLSFSKNMNNKYSQKPLDRANKSITNPMKTASKRAIQKTAEATGEKKIRTKLKFRSKS